MWTFFVCLANSKKFGERCVAGIKVEKAGGAYHPEVQDGKPKWLRPVSKLPHGAVAEHLVGEFRLMDIIEVYIEEYCPSSYQCENATFRAQSIKKIEKISPSEEILDRFVDMEQNDLFGNKGKAVSDDVIGSIGHSLTLIKTDDFHIMKRNSDGQLRIKFKFSHVYYDLPITDVDFIRNYGKMESSIKSARYLYLTISLGILHNSWHSKLVAGVLPI